MRQTLSVGDTPMAGYNLSVTTRDNGDSVIIMEELTYRTIKAWVMIVTKFLEQQVYTLPLDENGNVRGSVEQAYAYDLNTNQDTDQPEKPLFEFTETFGDARVTVWDTFKSNPRISFHLNSDDIPQVAVDTWVANQRAIQRAFTEFGGLKKDGSQARQDAPPQPAPAGERPATPKRQNAPQNSAVPLLTKKEAIAKLQAGDPFRMKIVQIERHSKDGKDYYDFFEPWGGKAGQYSAKTIYADNEIAINNGLITYLETLGVQLGQALTGNWIVNCTLGKPKTKTIKGEEKTYTDIYINSFEGQPQREAADRHPGMADDLPQG